MTAHLMCVTFLYDSDRLKEYVIFFVFTKPLLFKLKAYIIQSLYWCFLLGILVLNLIRISLSLKNYLAFFLFWIISEHLRYV